VAASSGASALFPDPVVQLEKGPAAVATGDFNGDGIQDLAVAEFLSNEVSILLGRGDGTFAAGLRFSSGSGPRMILTADINADGKVDLVVVNSSSNDLSVLLGQGDGTFAPEVRTPVDLHAVAIAVVAFNLDGNQDLVLGGKVNPPYAPGTVSVLLGNGDGTFVPGYTFTAGLGGHA